MGHRKSSPFHAAAELPAGEDAARAHVHSETDVASSWLRAVREGCVAKLGITGGEAAPGQGEGAEEGAGWCKEQRRCPPALCPS